MHQLEEEAGFEIRRRRAQSRFVAVQSTKTVCLALSHQNAGCVQGVLLILACL